MKKPRKSTKQRTTRNPVKGCIQKVKRAILTMAGIFFLCGLWVAYSNTNDVFHSKAGRLTTWGTGALVSPMIDAIPWYIWGVIAGFAVWMWVKHKLTMSIVYGLLLGLYIATM